MKFIITVTLMSVLFVTATSTYLQEMQQVEEQSAMEVQIQGFLSAYQLEVSNGSESSYNPDKPRQLQTTVAGAAAALVGIFVGVPIAILVFFAMTCSLCCVFCPGCCCYDCCVACYCATCPA